ncbi:MAG: T9SS type A sorting domain-containing protein [Flavobacteriales bacterium]|nr:T9SS type A sorting domain-containing protein [Flavobacteriales bacterium]
MKKTFLSLPLMVGSVAVMAQSAGGNTHDFKGYTKQHPAGSYTAPAPSHLPPSFEALRAAPFWTEDFSGGSVPAGWTNEDNLTPLGTDSVYFVWSNDPNAVGVAALGYQPSSIFGASDASNGYLWANSDRGLTASPGADHLTELTTTAIDCSGQPTVLLTFESLIGVFDYNANTNVKVQVSTDLNTWTDFIPFPCLETGSAQPPCSRWSANPQGIALDITSVAANQATVYIRFQWLGGWEYFWAIDDLALSNVPDYGRVVDFGYVSHVGGGVEFGTIPRPQLGSTFFLGGQLRNIGLNPQTNLVMTATVTAPGGGTAFSATFNAGTVNPGDTVNMDEAVTLPGGLAEGTYTMTLTVSSSEDALEDDPSDDTAERTFALDDLKYGLDGLGVHSGTAVTSLIGTSSFTDATDNVFCLNYFRINAPTTLYALNVDIGSNSRTGALMVASVHGDSLAILPNALGGSDDVFNPVATSLDYTVSAADTIAGEVTIPFSNPVTLNPGAYYVGVELFSNGGTNTVSVVDDATVPQPPVAGLINIQGTQPGSFTNGNAFAIRMIFDPTIGFSEVSGPEFSMFPNPTIDGQVQVITATSENHTIEVMNALGQTIQTGRFTGRTTVDLGACASGMYTIRVSNATGTTTRLVNRQ